jgi:hypothetical protein
MLVLSGAVAGIAVVVACGGGSMPLLDVVDAQSQESDAAGGGAGGSCDCTISQPVTVVGQVATAEDKPENWRVGSVDMPGPRAEIAKLADGPLVVTQVSASMGANASPDGSLSVFVGYGGKCNFATARLTLFQADRAIINSGAKLLVPAGEPLCAENTLFNTPATIAWWGYAPQ